MVTQTPDCCLPSQWYQLPSLASQLTAFPSTQFTRPEHQGPSSKKLAVAERQFQPQCCSTKSLPAILPLNKANGMSRAPEYFSSIFRTGSEIRMTRNICRLLEDRVVEATRPRVVSRNALILGSGTKTIVPFLSASRQKIRQPLSIHYRWEKL